MTKKVSVRRQLVVVFCGGFLGTLARYLLSIALQGAFGKAWPFDILLINVSGALALAFITTLADATFLIGPTRRLFINVGFLGAYTTFSSLALGDVLLYASDNPFPGLLYLFLSIGGGLLAVLAGEQLGLRCIARFQRKMLPTRISTHLDIEDDLLLPDEEEESETERTF